MDAHHARTGLIGLLLVTAALYLPVRDGGLVYEDVNWHQALYRERARIYVGLPSRSLGLLSLRWTRALTVAHGVNVGLHLVAGTLVYAVAATLATPLVAVGAAGLFLLHPLQIEAVAYLTGRWDLLVTVTILASVWGALHGWWGLVAVGVAASAGAKEIGVLAGPLVLLTLGCWAPHRLRGGWVVGTLLVGLLLLLVPSGGWVTMTPGYGGSGGSRATFAAWQLIGLGRELALVIWPVGFTIDHDPMGLSPLWGLLAIGGAIGGAGWTIWRRSWLGAWTLGWVLLTLAPRLVVRSAEFINEHQWYLPMAGLCVGVAATLARIVAVDGVDPRHVPLVERM